MARDWQVDLTGGNGATDGTMRARTHTYTHALRYAQDENEGGGARAADPQPGSRPTGAAGQRKDAGTTSESHKCE